jgi:hypothetical protein
MNTQITRAERIQQDGEEADRKIRRLEQLAEQEQEAPLSPRRGRPPKKSNRTPFALTLVGDSPEELDQKLAIFERIIGPKKRGNKRRGKLQLYVDLWRCFENMRLAGVKPPVGGNLSRYAFDFNRGMSFGTEDVSTHEKESSVFLGDVLRRHKITRRSDELLFKSSSHRLAIARRMRRVFDHVAKISTVH